MLLNIIFTSLIIPIQVHPLTHSKWQQSNAPIVQATIDAARIIGLPRMKDPDKAMQRTIYINELHSGPLYRLHSRKAFIREYVK